MTARWIHTGSRAPLPVATPGTPAPLPSPMGGDDSGVAGITQRELLMGCATTHEAQGVG